MPMPDEALVRTILTRNSRDNIFRNAIEGAWHAVLDKYPDRAWWRRQATRDGLVWEYAVNNVISGFDDDTDVRAIPHDDTISFIVEDTVLVRLKRADLRLRTSNYPTLMARLFHTHDVDLFGYQGLHRVQAAYVLNRFKTGIEWIGIVARDGKNRLWDFELGVSGASIERLPLPEKKEPAAARVIRPKLSPGKKQENERG